MPNKSGNPFQSDEEVHRSTTGDDTTGPSDDSPPSQTNQSTNVGSHDSTTSRPYDTDPTCAPDAETKRVGFYLPKTLDLKIERLALHFKELEGEKASKSEIAEAAIDLVLNDWEDNREESEVIEWLRKRKDAIE